MIKLGNSRGNKTKQNRSPLPCGPCENICCTTKKHEKKKLLVIFTKESGKVRVPTGLKVAHVCSASYPTLIS